MKSIQRLTAILISFVIIMLRITAVWAEGTVNLNLTASKAADNKKITVTISSNSNIDIQSMSMSLQYPNEWITPVSVSNQKGEQVSLSSDYAGNSGTVGLSLNAADKAIGSGSLCTVTFDVHQTFEKDTAIAFQLAVGTVLDSQGQAVKASAHGASVTVAAHAFSSQTSSTDNPTLSLNKTQITLSANETFQLVATIKSETAANHKVTYQSSDTSIVTVDAKGKITALKQGKATVTASLSGGNTAKCVVTVKPKIKEIILQKKEIKIPKGAKHTLKVAVLPDEASIKDLTYTSSNTHIATVNQNGQITAKQVGIATITVQTHDKSVSEKCIVTVTDDTKIITINGTLYDQKNKPLKNRKLELMPGSIAVTTNDKGGFTFANIENQDYTVYLYDKTMAHAQAKGTILSGDKDEYKIDIVLHNSNLIVSEAIEKVEETSVPLKSVHFATEEVRIKEKEEYQLIYTIEPKEATTQTIKLVAKDKRIVSVQQNGIVVGQSKGYTTISATTQDGTVLAKCIVHVDGADSNSRSYIIILVEAFVLFGLAVWFWLRYRRFQKRQKREEKKLEVNN